MRRGRGVAVLLLCQGLAACTGGQAKDPNERSATELYVLKGVQYMEAGRLDVARRDLEHAIELDGDNVEARNAMGVLEERQGRPAEAEAQFKRAMALDPGNTDVAVNYGRALCAQAKADPAKYEQAMRHFRTAIDSKLYATPWLALTNAGICAKSQNQPQEAEGYLRKALEANPNFAPALLEMARLSQATGKQLSARAFLQRYEAQTPEPTAESLALGIQVEQGLGNAKDAGAYLKKLQRLFPDSPEASAYRKPRPAP